MDTTNVGQWVTYTQTKKGAKMANKIVMPKKRMAQIALMLLRNIASKTTIPQNGISLRSQVRHAVYELDITNDEATTFVSAIFSPIKPPKKIG